MNKVTLFVLFQIAASYNCYLDSVDFPAAYLNSAVPQGKDIYIRLPNDVTKFMIETGKVSSNFISNGKLYIKLKKYLYGLRESGYEWYKLLSSTLIEMGFVKCIGDEGLFVKRREPEFVILGLHVDDLLVVSNSKNLRARFIQDLESIFGNITYNPNTTSYLGLRISHVDDGIFIDQTAFIKELLLNEGISGVRRSPSTQTLFDIDTNKDQEFCNEEEKKKFLSVVMSLMFIGQLSRPDVLKEAAFLATRSAICTKHDWSKLFRVLRYLNGSLDYGLLFRRVKNFDILGYSDASFNCHYDGKGHTGYLIKLGWSMTAPVVVKSFKQRIVTRSSTEAELLAAEECVLTMIFIKDIMKFLGFAFQTAPTLRVDNTSTITQIKNGFQFKTSRHLVNKLFFVRQFCTLNELLVEYLNSDLMPADLLTKPFTLSQFLSHRYHLITAKSQFEVQN